MMRDPARSFAAASNGGMSAPIPVPQVSSDPADHRLVVVSNRIPVSFATENGTLVAKPSSGGLIGALEPVLENHGGMWVGSVGAEDSPQLREQLAAATQELNFHYVPVILTDEEQAKYYEGFSNEVLWPLFHDLQSLCHFDPEYWDFYERVNRKFAEVISATARESDAIWVQDYQLLRVAHALRERRPNAVVSFFLHIPFPPPDIFAKLPWRGEVLKGLLDYDFIGVQTARDERNFTASVRAFVPGAKVTGRGDQKTIVTAARATRIRAIPISIDFTDFAAAANSEAVLERAQSIRNHTADMEIAIGVDRLDYTKGIPERMRAFRAFLRLHPDFRRKVTFMQVVVPSREGIV